MKDFILNSIELCAKYMKKAIELAKVKTAASFKEAANIMKGVMGTLDSLTQSAANLTGVSATVIKTTLVVMTLSAGIIYNSVKSPPEEPPLACSPSNCPSPKVCNNNQCVDPPPPLACSPSNCPSPKVCNNNQCVDPPPPPLACSPSNCPSPKVCNNNQCVDPPGPPVDPRPPAGVEGKFLFSTDSYKQCISDNMPNYLNNSMTWGGPSHMGALPGYKAISPPTIIVTTAGNAANKGRPFIDKNKKTGAKEFDAILVGSVSPYGHRSVFSQKGEEVTIMAPSNYELTAADKNGRYRKFSGTSGAAPLVTGSLATFSWMAGYQPTAAEAKLLLKKTAIPLRSSNANPQLNGPGMLNAYKLGMVGKRLREECGTDIACFKNLIQQDSTYDFPEEEGLMEIVEKAFPECSVTKCLERSKNCADKAAAFEKLRKATFLNPSADKEHWRYLSCIYSSSGFADNAKGMRGIYDALLGAPPAENRFERDGKWLAGYSHCQGDADCSLVLSCDNTVDDVNTYYQPANKNYVTECQGPVLCGGQCRCDGELKEPVNVRVFTMGKDDYYADSTKIIKSSQAICVNSQCVAKEISSSSASGGSTGSVQ